ncbi:hypothetical protein B296_00026776, partial [Ensete ventricosum]
QEETIGSAGIKPLRVFALLGVGFSGALAFASLASADEAEHGLPAPICASCHSMSLISFRDLVGVAYTEEETKAMAAEIEVVDGPNDEGEMFTRPGKLSDRFPQPYANEQAARFANGGAYPPDLSLITKARHNGQNYVFALLTGYRDPPAGVSVIFYGKAPYRAAHTDPSADRYTDGPLFFDRLIAGWRFLLPVRGEGLRRRVDTEVYFYFQMGKDVVTFLSWAAEPEMEERKLVTRLFAFSHMGFKWIFVLSLALLQAAYYRRLKWSVLKSRKLVLDVVN